MTQRRLCTHGLPLLDFSVVPLGALQYCWLDSKSTSHGHMPYALPSFKLHLLAEEPCFTLSAHDIVAFGAAPAAASLVGLAAAGSACIAGAATAASESVAAAAPLSWSLSASSSWAAPFATH